MLLRGMAAAGVALLGVVVSAHVVLNGARFDNDASARPLAGEAGAGTLAMAPISLGNPQAAATLSTRHPEVPESADRPSTPYSHTLRVGRGDILGSLLVEAGIDPNEAHAAVVALRRVYDPRRMRPGQEVALTLRPGAGAGTAPRLESLALDVDFARAVNLERSEDGGFAAKQIEKSLTEKLLAAEGEIQDSLYADAAKAGVPLPVLVEMVRAYSWDVDFQRDIHPGDRFAVMYEGYFEGERPVHVGGVLSAILTLGGKEAHIYRFETGDGETDYYNPQGQSVRKAMLRTPIDGARLSSGFGKRMHPILGYTTMHRGIDFAAPTGTPIYAAGDGRIEEAGANGAYGNYVRIRHGPRYASAYAHMSRLARGIAPKRRVTQGEIIGYVGSTGRSTGPHLHYEILEGGRRINPLNVKMPAGRKLEGAELARFSEARAALEKRFATLLDGKTLAQGD